MNKSHGIGKERTKLVEPKAPTEKYDTECANKENEGTTGHLIYRDGCVKKADIHQLVEQGEI